MPDNPNAPNPERTQPATEPKPEAAPAATPEPVGDYGNAQYERDIQDPTAVIAEQVSNPDTVKAVVEFLKAEKLTFDEVEIEEGMWGWSEGSDIAHITMPRNEHSPDYFVSPNEDTTNRMAIALVKNDLETEPGIFNSGFIRSHIDEDHLRDTLRSDVEEMAREDARERGVEEDEDAIERQVEDELRDPVQYLIDIYGEEQGMEQAVKLGRINLDEAAEDAVGADGEGHFLASYDGDVHDLPSGGQWWRHN